MDKKEKIAHEVYAKILPIIMDFVMREDVDTIEALDRMVDITIDYGSGEFGHYLRPSDQYNEDKICEAEDIVVSALHFVGFEDVMDIITDCIIVEEV